MRENNLINLIFNCLKNEIEDNEIVEFYLGDYGQFDFLSLKACLEFKKIHQNSKIYFITPYIVPSYLKNRKESLDLFDDIIYPDLENTPKKYAILKRNFWMVNQADLAIFYVKYTWGGAYKTMQYAKTKKKRIINIAEKTFKNNLRLNNKLFFYKNEHNYKCFYKYIIYEEKLYCRFVFINT